MFLINQAGELERRQLFLQTQEASRQEDWEHNRNQEEETRFEACVQERNKKEAQQIREAMAEEHRMLACQSKPSQMKRSGTSSAPSSSNNMRGFKKPRKVSMFDELR